MEGYPQKNNIILVLFLVFTFVVNAQVRLKQHHFFSIGDTIVECYNRLPQNSINIGESGENKIWDFSNLNAIVTNKQTITFVDPKETPFTKDYPEANIALYANNGYKTWQFMKSSRKKIVNLGHGVFINTEKQTNNYGGIDIHFPLKYLDHFSKETVTNKILVKNNKGQDSIKVKTVFNHIYDIDSWGDVILPKGIFLSLRLKHTLNVTNYTYKKQESDWVLLKKPETTCTISYKWWTDDENAKYPVVQIVMDNANEKPIVVQYIEATPFSEIITEVKEEYIKIYPNPAKEKLFIKIPTIEETYIAIYNLEGRIVKNVQTNTTKTELDINLLPSGIYLIVNRNKEGNILGKSKFVKI